MLLADKSAYWFE